ncbi:asparagine synthase (glutamine-hydrolysing) [Chryseobacterium sp. 52]|uniref:asparagine synthase (glutamine-hydrolyzing) n=1 Tax=Chryseobacterium sp. 52 TaxID=2035213 RepID=UPI000C18A756|nr:asparagine synthase (glutamine-hydrolyzing) [Chryseobacterium sp. 52]PIF47078.1 asparagine synthase (glutamine-hydrolysing) [Chryseobacterium sp. 52]
MCGISGLIYRDKTRIDSTILKRMTDKMSHRGPDAEGFYINENSNLGLGHRRLSIIDTSEAANQPFFFEDKYVLVFNGAIYNYIEIREDLEKQGYTFKTNSDTEVLIASYDCWGEECTKKFNGMWAFAIFDSENNKLFCSRDRFGIKPFYYYADHDKFVFASEIKPILEVEKIEKVNVQILLQYLIVNMGDHKETFFEGISKLPASHNLVYDFNTHQFQINKYYEIEFKKEVNKLSLDESIKLFEEKFEESVRLRLRSDVKIGSALSGGLDSPYVTSVANKIIDKKNNSDFTAITVGSLDKRDDESGLAKIISEALNINHDIVIPKPDEFNEGLEDVIFMHEEPFAELSIFMQNFLMKEANKLGIKVFLDGQGADEILLGYSRYTAAFLRNHGWISNIKFLRGVKSHYNISILEAIKIYFYFSNYFIRKVRLQIRGSILKKKYLGVINFIKLKTLAKSYKNIFELQKNEIFYFLLPCILRIEDKNSMLYSIESRLPFLDYQFVETVLSINNNYKIRDGWSKYILRRALEKFVPDEITYNNRKIGLNAPVEHWWPRSEKIIETINNSKIIQEISKKKFDFIEDRDLEWRLYNIAVWEKLYNMKIEK